MRRLPRIRPARSLLITAIFLLSYLALPVQPASAGTWCNSASWTVTKISPDYGTNEYFFRHTLGICSDQNPSYWTITQVTADYVNYWGVQSPWVWNGVNLSNTWNDYWAGLWTRYTTQKQGDFKWCVGNCSHVYPRIDMHGESSGYIYTDYARSE